MYGYFRPYDSELNDNHKRIFQSYYCRLCYCLWQFGGQTVRYFTTFDLTLYSMIMHLSCDVDAPPFLGCQRVLTSNRNRFKNDELGLKLAKLSLITFGEKFRDDLIDEGGFKNRLKGWLFGKKVKKACAEEPEIARLAFEGTERINRMQEQNAEIGALLEAYADAMEQTVLAVCDVKKPYVRLLRSLARWTYFVDILCDYDEDCKKNQYNPLRKEGVNTLQDYLAANYYDLFLKNREISHEVYDALTACKSDRPEWDVLFKIIVHSLNTVVAGILRGEDVTFHYFKELLRNKKRISEEKKAIKKRDHESR